jgi:cation transport ATPase
VPPEGFPAYQGYDQSQRQSNVSEANMNSLVTSEATFAVFESLLVFFDHHYSLRIHQVFERRFHVLTLLSAFKKG